MAMKGKDGDKNHLSPHDQNGKDGRVSPTPSWRPASALSSRTEDEEEPPLPQFRPYDKKSWDNQIQKDRDAQRKLDKNNGKAVAHLVDGELKFEDDEEEARKTRDPTLQEGNILPDELSEVFKEELYGKPLEEIDKYIKDKTFVAIAPRFQKNYIHRFTATKALGCLTPWNPARKFSVYIATNQFFDYLVILTILCNCVFLAMPDDPASETAEYVFLGIYTMECVVKILARGLIVNKFTYLRDPWNWLDFIVIISAYVTIIIDIVSTPSTDGESDGSVFNPQMLRTFRVLRALKTVSIVPGLKTIVGALLRAFKLLFEVIILTSFCLMIFALFGLQVYVGVLRQKCVLDVPEYNATASLSYVAYYNDWIKNNSNWYEDGEGAYLVCGNASASGECPSGYTCLPDIGENPNYGYTSFDHFGWAMLTSFQLITLDFWEDTYNKIIRAMGPWNVLFFVIVVFFGSFYLINLMLAVVAMSYEEEAVNTNREREEKERKEAVKEKKEKAAKDKANAAAAAAASEVTAAKATDATAAKSKPPSKEEGKQSNGTNNNKDSKVGTDSKSGTVTINGKTLTNHGKGRNPMVKMPSKDSGYSVQSNVSSHSGGSKDKDDPDSISLDSHSNPRKADSGTGSMSHGLNTDSSDKTMSIPQKPFIKQDSLANVSSSGIHLGDDDDSLSTKGKSKKPPPKIIQGSLKNSGEESTGRNEPGTLVDRNHACLGKCCYCYVPWLRIQNLVFIFVSDPLFDLFITFCILVNTIFMGLEFHNMPDDLVTATSVANIVFTVIFTLEAVLKLTAFGKFYFSNGWNNFDLVIVVASWVDFGLSDLDGVNVIRTFRLLRVFKLAQAWRTMRVLLTIIMSTLGALGNLTVILVIIIYIFAVIGLQLFRNSYTEDKFGGDGIPRWNFNSFFHALMLIFRILCGEWIEELWNCMRAADELCMVVFLPTLVFGYFIVLNLFLALLLNAFGSESLKKSDNDDEDDKLSLAFVRLKEICCCCCNFKKTPRTSSVGPDELDEEKQIGMTDLENDSKDKQSKDQPLANGTVKANGIKHDDKVEAEEAFNAKRDKFTDFDAARKASKAKDSKGSNADSTSKTGDSKEKKGSKDKDGMALGDEADDMDDDDENKETVVEDCFPPICMKKYVSTFSDHALWSDFDESSFGIKWHKARYFMCKIVEHKAFEYFILACIFLSSMSLAFEDVYLYTRPELEAALYYANIIFAALFTIEMLMKWMALGFKKYFTSFWTILDFCIVVISLTSLIVDAMGGEDISAFRSLRTLRAFRPLRAISRWQSMRIVVNALMLAIPAILNVLVVCMVFWLIFSIMGVQFFSGRFYKCKDSSGEVLLPSVVANKSQCLAMASTHNYTWVNSNINFDNVFNGYLALFQVATYEGWMEVMDDAVDSTKVDEQPSFENNLYMYLYFVAFIIFGSFFTLNLIIGVIIDNFNALKKKYDGSALDMFLTQGQKNYMNTLKKLGSKKPQKTIKRPKASCQAVFYDVAVSSKFDICIVSVIFLNMIAMAVDHYKMTDYVSNILDILNILFTTVFTLESVVKIIGLRHHYFRQPWNVFDFVVVILSLVGIVLADVLANSFNPTLLRVLRVFRIGRVLRLIKAAKGIRKLLFALIISLPALINIGALLCLIMYIFAIIGMSLFGNMKIDLPLDDTVNFQTFASSFVLLLRLSTSAGWNDILETMFLQPPDCDPDYATRPEGGAKFKYSTGDCGSPAFGVFYMVAYILIIFLVVINMYIAIILENFNQAHEAEEVGITEDDFDEFYVVWEKYDPLATQFIKYEHLSHFVGDLDPPLGIPRPNEIALVAFDLPIVEGDKIHCLDVLIALCKNVLGRVEETEEFKELKSQMEDKFQETFPTRVNTSKTSSTMQKKKEDVAAKTLQRAWRTFKTQKQLRNLTKMAMQKAEADENEKNTKSKGASLANLGRRLNSALSNFFSSSRPSSATSRHSIKSQTTASTPGNSQRKSKSTLQVPAVGPIYPAKCSDKELDL
ncbi:sodium channel protein 1 brain-like isoform X8 [Ostrea edulis]|uniref:sodium channel protein 1 brain-like isoform X8 n=1 Tax=Ostrea edulis TaxID=37623 RepID=UPI0024AFADF3|nr:sodium channel protein 1 brain-like isoform X8 [Ostrea edulis]XP_056021117.1 sodium channel protein 1 brain-like isoform X8 [Ostrea edulis]